MDFGRAFSYVFDDPDWLKKVGIVALISLIPFLGWLVMLGWSLRVTRRVIARRDRPLPDVDFGTDIALGFKGFLISLVYALPLILVWTPITIGMVAVSENANDAAAVGFILVMLCFGFLTLLYGILIGLLIPAALTLMAEKDDLVAGLRFRDAWRLVRRQPGAYLVVIAGTLLSGLLAQLGGIACIIGAALTYAYAYAVNGHLYGQAYLVASKDEAPAVLSPVFPPPSGPSGPPTPPDDLPSGY